MTRQQIIDNRQWNKTIGFILFSVIYILLSAPSAHASALILPPNNINLVGYWALNDGSGTTAVDKSGSGNTGTLTNGPTWVDGKFGKALNFDGSNDYVDTGNTFSLPNGSMSLWLKTSLSGVEKDIGGNYNNANSTFQLYQGADGKFNFFIRNNAGTYGNLTSTNVINDNNWHLITFTWGAAGQTLYVDGSLNVSNAVTAYNDTITATLFLGAFNRAGAAMYFWPGSIDDVRIYSRALSATEISRMYQQGSKKRASVNTTGLVGYWRFNEGSGSVATDVGSGRNNGTLTNGPTWTTGKYGAGVLLDGSDDYVVVPDNSALNVSTSFTMAAWVKLGATGQDNAIFDSGTQGNHWLVQIESVSNKIDFVERLIADNPSNTSLTAGAWYHVAVVKSGDSGTNVTFYLNGVADGTASVGSVSTPSGNKRIGNWTESNAQTLNGAVDDVRIYNRALSATEIANLYADTAASKITKINTSPVNSLTNGLVGYWTFDGGDTTTATTTDRSGNGNTGTLTNGPTPTQGRRGQALRFDGTNDFVDTGDPVSGILDFGTNSFSVSAWIKLAVLPSSNAFTIVSKGKNDAPPFNEWDFSAINNGVGVTNLRFLTYNTNQTPNFSSAIGTTNLVTGVWYHVVGMRSGTTNIVYINGVSEGSAGSSVQDVSSTYALEIGRRDDPIYFSGSIDDVRIYNRALTAAEVLQLYKMGQ